jgi:hypothetical protein
LATAIWGPYGGGELRGYPSRAALMTGQYSIRHGLSLIRIPGYKQVSDDSGPGANLGAFRAKSVGLGPVLSYAHKIGGRDTIWELKWLHETDTVNRLQGNIGWLKAVYKF